MYNGDTTQHSWEFAYNLQTSAQVFARMVVNSDEQVGFQFPSFPDEAPSMLTARRGFHTETLEIPQALETAPSGQ